MISVFSSPNPILFGRGVSSQTGSKLLELGCSKVLVVFDPGIKKSGLADRIIKIINDAGIKTVSYDGVQADPPDWSVEEAGALGTAEQVDGVVGLGGGSSLDTAKAAKMLLTNPPPIAQYFGREGVITKPSKPLIVIPTTAGTGSECTPGGVITDTKNGIKTNISGVGCKIDLGIVDPELTIGLPASVTAVTGLDALCHAAESYTSALSNRFCEITAREALSLIAGNLERAVSHGDDIDAREAMMLAATLGGISMSGPLCHLAHDIGKVIGAGFHIPHGNACALTLPQVLQTVASAVPEKVRYIAQTFGADLSQNATPGEIGSAACAVMQKLMKNLKIPNMRDLKLSRDELLQTVPDGVVAMQEGLVKLFGQGTCPVTVSNDLIANIITRAYDEN